MEKDGVTTILCYGDSNTYGYDPRDGFRYPLSVRWTGLLQQELGPAYRVIEEGCNGRTTVYDDPVDNWKNGLSYLKPSLNSHKPVDIVILMLGSNDLKEVFHLTPAEIAEGAATLVRTIQEFTEEKQVFQPRIILVSPPEIGPGIRNSVFYGRFQEDAVARSRQFPAYYQEVARKYGCSYQNAAEWVRASEIDSLHLDPEGHRIMAEKLAEAVRALPAG